MSSSTDLQSLLSPNYKSIEDLPYRRGAIGIILNKDNKFLIVQMLSYSDNQWRFPGGGIENEETPRAGLLRELKEELGSDKFEVLKESKISNKYDWPEEVIIKQIKDKNRYFRGQIQNQFLIRFTGTEKDLVVDPGELKDIKWVSYNELPSHFVFEKQWELAEVVLKELLG